MKAKGPKLYKKVKTSGEIHKDDFKYMYQKPDGDVGFSLDHNRRVIENGIKKTNQRIKQLKKEYSEQLNERVDAASYYLRAIANNKTYSSNPKTAALKYFGKRELARLRGNEIREQIMSELAQNAGIMKN